MMKFTKVDGRSSGKPYLAAILIMAAVAVLASAGMFYFAQNGFAGLGIWRATVGIVLGILIFSGFVLCPLVMGISWKERYLADSSKNTVADAVEVMSARYGGEFTNRTISALLGGRRIYALTDGLTGADAEEDWYGPIVPVAFGNLTKNVRLANRKGGWLLVDVTDFPNDRLWDAPELELARA